MIERIGHQLQGFTLMVLLPLFFAGVGLRTSVGLISGSVAHWLLFGAVLTIAVATKLLGGYGGARLGGLPRQDALRMGVLMNCRGVTELVVATIGYQYHLINELGLTVLTLVALITTAATAPAMRLLQVRSMTPFGAGR
jgi:Kef-type K+ transport system membrane component KefB